MRRQQYALLHVQVSLAAAHLQLLRHLQQAHDSAMAKVPGLDQQVGAAAGCMSACHEPPPQQQQHSSEALPTL
jgi:hypothetical protein